MRGLDWQTINLPFASGMNQKPDPRALQAPELAKCIDVQFDEVGGLQTRYPYAALGSDILDGGTISNSRRIVRNGSELLLFTSDTLYSWNAQLSKWVEKAEHLAIKVEEEPRFVTTGEQIECDRAELDDLVVYAWTDDNAVWAAAVDKETGSVVVAPTDMSNGDTINRPRVIALDTIIYLFWNSDTDGYVHIVSIDPANPTGTIVVGADSVVGSSAHNDYYDVVSAVGSDTAVMVQRLTPTTSYGITTIAADFTQASSTKARACTGPIAVSCDPSGTNAQIVRTDTLSIVGDLITISSLADVYTNQAIATAADTIYHVTAAHRSVQDSSAYRCYAFWTEVLSSQPNTGGLVGVNWVDTGNTIGTSSTLVRLVSLASRAFDYNGQVYVNVAFAGISDVTSSTVAYGQRAALQNSYFLYRDDGFLCAKQAMNRAGGFPSTAWLPGVALISDTVAQYAWCGMERRIVPVGGDGTGYADRGPRDIKVTFDSNEARRCVRLGQTLYITGGELLQYDGAQIVEVGSHYYPYHFELNESLTHGNLANGTYFYKGTYRWNNARGEIDRSTTASAGGIVIASGPGGTLLTSIGPLEVTHKTGVAVEMWRTLVAPTEDAPYYLVTSMDPTDASGANCYLANDTTVDTLSFNDDLVDADVRVLAENPENGNVLENLAPPAATIIAANDTRLFLAGIAGDHDRVWYSKQRGEGEVAAFHDVLTIAVPPGGGDITALAFLNETLIVFRETAVYMLPGDGLDNTGNGQNYGPARALSLDIGAVNAEGVASTDKGLIFKSRKGWYLLNRGWALDYIGGPVSDYDDHEPLAIDVVESQHQVRILVAIPAGFDFPADEEGGFDPEGDPISRMLVLDTLVGQWGEWTVSHAIHACMYGGAHHYLADAGPRAQLTYYFGVDYGLDIETAWIKLGDLQNYGKVRRFMTLGEYLGSHKLRVRVARDYWKDGVDTYFDDKYWTPSPATTNGPEQVRHGPSIKSLQAIKIRLTAVSASDTDDPPDNEALKLTGLALEIGFKGPNRLLPAAQKQ